MTMQTLSWAFEQAPGTPAQKLVLVLLADGADMDDAWNGDLEALAAKAQLTVAELGEVLFALQGAGFIQRSDHGIILNALP